METVCFFLGFWGIYRESLKNQGTTWMGDTCHPSVLPSVPYYRFGVETSVLRPVSVRINLICSICHVDHFDPIFEGHVGKEFPCHIIFPSKTQ